MQLPDPEPATADPKPTRRLKVLIVDDMMEVAQTIGWVIEEMGHTYRLVHDGRQVLEAARDFRPDAILLDIGLPGMDGYAVCRLLRQDPELKGTTIIAQSGWGQDKHKASAVEAGFDHHVVKPIDFCALERIIAGVSSAGQT